MARTFTSGEARRLVEAHADRIARLSQAEPTLARQREAIRAAALAMLEQAAREALASVPIEEINRGKRGLRVKPLREAGIETVADLAYATVGRIADIRGIGEETAREILAIAREIAAQAAKASRIRLNADRKTDAATRLVTAIARYRRMQTPAGQCRKLADAQAPAIEDALRQLSPGTSGLRWLFASRGRKDAAEAAFERLSILARGEYWAAGQAALDAFSQALTLSGVEAWHDFEAQSIGFFGVLEDIIPGVLGADEAEYGLPEDLAREVREQPIQLEGMRCALRRYQAWGVKYILRQERVLLGDEMGLGKTIQAIAAMVSLANAGETHFMVVCPAGVLANWCREIESKSVLRAFRVHGDARDAALRDWLETGGVAVTTYETTARVELPQDFSFAMLVVDEAHYVKNALARRTANVKALSERARRLLFMTGTVLENRVDEMIALIRMLNPQVASRIGDMARLSAAPQFREAVAPVYYRRKREDVLAELPEMIESREWCALLPEERDIYETAVLERRFSDARRVSWTAPDPGRSSKARRMLELIDMAAADGRKVLVFSFFLETIRLVCDLLGDRCMPPISGAVPPQRRQEIIDAFDAAPPGTVLVGQVQSGGTGLNIQSASVVILCEPQFKPSSESQAVSRAYRMGQTRTVLVYRLLCEDTVDERMIERLEEKQRAFDAFADTSAAADASLELDAQGFSDIIDQEIERIRARRALTE